MSGYETALTLPDSAIDMVLQKIGGGRADGVTVGCLDWDRFDRHRPSWQDCIQEYRYRPHRDSERGRRVAGPGGRSENLSRNLPSMRGESPSSVPNLKMFELPRPRAIIRTAESYFRLFTRDEYNIIRCVHLHDMANYLSQSYKSVTQYCRFKVVVYYSSRKNV